MEMIRGCRVPHSDRLTEQYVLKDHEIIASITVGSICKVIKRFITMQTEPMFFLLELPASMTVEKQLRKEDDDLLHKAVYYMDGLNMDEALGLMDEFGELLIHDGMSSFGFGIKSFSAEIVAEKYNILRVWAKKPEMYKVLFDELHVPQVEDLFTAWNTFTKAEPGDSFCISVDGTEVYDLVDVLKERGLYFAEYRERYD